VGSQRLVIATLPAVGYNEQRLLIVTFLAIYRRKKKTHNSNISVNLLLGEHRFTIVILFIIESSRWKQRLAIATFPAIGPKKKML
jgi:hypothetical protein